jgi:hypothetical protein
MHFSVRLWWLLSLVRGCSCGRLRPCVPPDLRVRDSVGDRLPDGVTVPWPVNRRWANERTQELPQRSRSWLTPGHSWRADQARRRPA